MTTIKEKIAAPGPGPGPGATDPLIGAVKAYRKNIIRRFHAAGVEQTVIADVFGITRQAVYYLVHNDVTTPEGASTAILLDGWDAPPDVAAVQLDGVVSDAPAPAPEIADGADAHVQLDVKTVTGFSDGEGDGADAAGDR